VLFPDAPTEIGGSAKLIFGFIVTLVAFAVDHVRIELPPAVILDGDHEKPVIIGLKGAALIVTFIEDVPLSNDPLIALIVTDTIPDCAGGDNVRVPFAVSVAVEVMPFGFVCVIYTEVASDDVHEILKVSPAVIVNGFA
jgi:hypothetical protein